MKAGRELMQYIINDMIDVTKYMPVSLLGALAFLGMRVLWLRSHHHPIRMKGMLAEYLFFAYVVMLLFVA